MQKKIVSKTWREIVAPLLRARKKIREDQVTDLIRAMRKKDKQSR